MNPFTAPTWLSTLGAAVVGGLIVFAFLKTTPSPQPDPSYFLADHQRHQPSPEAPDGGVAEEALASVEMPSASAPASMLGMPMPPEPYPRQKRPPCEPKTQKAINGGCWFGPAGRSPCGAEAFDHEGGCYLPVIMSPRRPTSDEP